MRGWPLCSTQSARQGEHEIRENLRDISVYLDVEDEVGGLRHSDLKWAASLLITKSSIGVIVITHLLSLWSSALKTKLYCQSTSLLFLSIASDKFL